MAITIGDVVECLYQKSTNYGKRGEVTWVSSEELECRYDNGELGRGKLKFYKLISIDKKNNVVDKIMSLKENFVLAITSEPMRSFRKAGITARNCRSCRA